MGGRSTRYIIDSEYVEACTAACIVKVCTLAVLGRKRANAA
jgi:hypothetical protein